MQLSEHFTLAEATISQEAMRRGINNTPSPDIVSNMVKAANRLEQVRSVLNFPIHINSWFRCLDLNRAIGSSDSSSHVQGWAIDFICPNFGTPREVCIAIAKSGLAFDQIIYEGTWTHISFDPRMRGNVLTAVFKPGEKTHYVIGIK